MTDALRQAGAMRGTKVVDMTCEPVGNGLVGDSYRFGLAYEEVEPDAPASVIGKFPAADPDSRRSGSAHLLYLREVSFYRELAHTLPINTPRPFVAQIDPETDDFILIREDLAGGSARRLFTRRRQDRAGGGCGVARPTLGRPGAAIPGLAGGPPDAAPWCPQWRSDRSVQGFRRPYDANPAAPPFCATCRVNPL